MCNPLLALGTGLTVAGGVARAANGYTTDQAERSAEQEAYNRSRSARMAELGRQQAWDNEAFGGTTDTINALSKANYDTAQNNAVADFMHTVDSRPTSIPDGFNLSGQSNATNEVQAEIARRTALAAQDARNRIEALAKISSYDSAALNRALALSANSDALSTINNLRRGSMNVSRSEQTIPAATVTPGDNTLADILSGSGGLLSGASWAD